MAFILDIHSADKNSKEQWDRYYSYLESVRTKMPKNVYEFALADWHYNPEDYKCPHDSWVEKICINEIPFGDRKQVREIEIKLILLGAYHNGYIELSYKDVITYNVNKKPQIDPTELGHGDWLIDEIRLSQNNNVIHEILFNNGHLLIECAEIIYQWKDLKVK